MSSQDAKTNGSVAIPTPLETDVHTRDIRVEASKHNEELPISKLPFDVLSNIFLLCRWTASIEEQYDLPGIVSYVCKRWHATASSTPLLWNTILLFGGTNDLSKLEAHIIRSGTCFLDIYLFLPTRDTRAAMDLLATRCRYWRKFYVETGDKELSDLFFEYLRDVSTPVLEYIHLSANSRTRYIPSFPATHPAILRDAPSLQFAHLFGSCMTALQPPLTNVTTLELDSELWFHTKPSEIVRAFTEMRSPVKLSICGFSCETESDLLVDITPVTMPRLRALHINRPGDSSPFSFLVLPSLESLVLLGLASIRPSLLPSILPSVKNLTLEGCGGLTERDFANLGRSCPSVTHLNVDTIGMHIDHWFSYDILWPSLQRITFIDIIPGYLKAMSPRYLYTLRNIVSVRIVLEHPIKEVFLDEESRTALEKNGWLDWFEERVALTFSDDFKGWSTVSAFPLPRLFADWS